MISVKCLFCKKEFKVYPTLVRRGYGKYCSRICRNKGRLVEFPYIRENCKKRAEKYLRLKGDQAPGWKGGISPINEKLRKKIEQKSWRQQVFMRDNYTCQICGNKGVDLNAHHIKSFADYPELRLDTDNGITICCKCHKKAHENDRRKWGILAPAHTKFGFKDSNHFQYTK